MRGVRGDPAMSLASERITCNHSNIPAKELYNINLESSRAVLCGDRSSFFNCCLEFLRNFLIILCYSQLKGRRTFRRIALFQINKPLIKFALNLKI